MPRKAALVTETLGHFAVDFACFFLLAGSFAQGGKTSILLGAGYLIFLLLSYGLRPVFGMILDESPLLHSQALGCLLVAIALFLPSSWGWVALFPAGVGSALFHTGAVGEGVCFARGYFSRIATLISTGVFGAAAGTLVAQRTALKPWVVTVVLLIVAVACFFFAEARKYPRKIRSFRHSVNRVLPDGLTLGLTLIPLFVISLVTALLPADWAEGPLRLIPAGICMLGRAAGGITADRFGPRKTALVCFASALLLLTVFPHIPWVYCIGLGVLCVPTALCFGTATAALPQRPHLAVGTCSVVILLGSFPGFFRNVPTVSLRLLCGGLMIVALAASAVVYTDYCRLFDLRAKLHLRKGAKG